MAMFHEHGACNAYRMSGIEDRGVREEERWRELVRRCSQNSLDLF
jgi:hypothetical protein